MCSIQYQSLKMCTWFCLDFSFIIIIIIIIVIIVVVVVDDVIIIFNIRYAVHWIRVIHFSYSYSSSAFDQWKDYDAKTEKKDWWRTWVPRNIMTNVWF